MASISAPSGRQGIASAGFVSTRPATILAPYCANKIFMDLPAIIVFRQQASSSRWVLVLADLQRLLKTTVWSSFVGYVAHYTILSILLPRIAKLVSMVCQSLKRFTKNFEHDFETALKTRRPTHESSDWSLSSRRASC